MRRNHTHKTDRRIPRIASAGVMAAVAVAAFLPASALAGSGLPSAQTLTRSAVLPAPATSPSHANEVFGTCQLQGVTTITNQATGAFRFAADGLCIGELNGQPTVGAHLHVTYRGTATVLGGLVPATGSGAGVATISDPARPHGYRFRFTGDQVGTALTATCHGGGSAVAALVPTEPPTPNATRIHVAGVLQTLTPCRS